MSFIRFQPYPPPKLSSWLLWSMGFCLSIIGTFFLASFTLWFSLLSHLPFRAGSTAGWMSWRLAAAWGLHNLVLGIHICSMDLPVVRVLTLQMTLNPKPQAFPTEFMVVTYLWCTCEFDGYCKLSTWQESLSEGMPRSGWSLDMSVENCLGYIIEVRKPTHWGWHHSWGLGSGLCKSEEGKLSSKQACTHSVLSPLWIRLAVLSSMALMLLSLSTWNGELKHTLCPQNWSLSECSVTATGNRTDGAYFWWL